jgi:hypothetical protein
MINKHINIKEIFDRVDKYQAIKRDLVNFTPIRRIEKKHGVKINVVSDGVVSFRINGYHHEIRLRGSDYNELV